MPGGRPWPTNWNVSVRHQLAFVIIPNSLRDIEDPTCSFTTPAKYIRWAGPGPEEIVKRVSSKTPQSNDVNNALFVVVGQGLDTLTRVLGLAFNPKVLLIAGPSMTACKRDVRSSLEPGRLPAK